MFILNCVIDMHEREYPLNVITGLEMYFAYVMFSQCFEGANYMTIIITQWYVK